MKQKKLLKHTVLPVFMLLNGILFSQNYFHVTPCQTAGQVEALVDTLILGNIPPEYKNDIVFTGDPAAVGYFTDYYHLLGFDGNSGMVMTTGKADFADDANVCNSNANASYNNNGPNNADPDLQTIGNGSSFDLCKIEFDVYLTQDSMTLSYVFASEEYHEYVFQFNDVFGFFLSGNMIQGDFSNNADIISKVPESTQFVSINSVNFGKGGNTCTGKPTGCTNCQYLKDNSQSSDPGFSQMVYDAYTVPLLGSHSVAKNHWYHVKLSIADIMDAIFDSGIFIEKNFLTQYTVTGTDNENKDKITVFPNPAGEILYVDIPQNISPVDLILKDINGNVLFEKQNVCHKTSVSLKSCPKGIFILETKNKSGVKYTKVIHK